MKRIMQTVRAGAIMAVMLASPLCAQDITSSVDAAKLPKPKQTSLGLYLTPQDAFTALEANPDIVFLDVRDPSEVMFVGHPKAVDKVVPVARATYQYDPKKSAYKMAPNGQFVDQVNIAMNEMGKTKDDPVFVMCRSGGRSAKAATQLIKAGYTNVWNLVEGFEGDMAKDGTRSLNGWRNAGLPWTYKLSETVVWKPSK